MVEEKKEGEEGAMEEEEEERYTPTRFMETATACYVVVRSCGAGGEEWWEVYEACARARSKTRTLARG